jgi:hypothetical protein
MEVKKHQMDYTVFGMVIILDNNIPTYSATQVFFGVVMLGET